MEFPEFFSMLQMVMMLVVQALDDDTNLGQENMEDLKYKYIYYK